MPHDKEDEETKTPEQGSLIIFPKKKPRQWAGHFLESMLV